MTRTRSRPGFAARVVLDDRAVEWVKQGTPASFGYATMYRSEWQSWEICRSGYVTEVSILTAGTRPAESAAQVVLLRDVAPIAASELIEETRGVIRRECGRVLAVR